MKKKEKDAHFAAHLPTVLRYHQTMLSDGVRNELLYKAIKQHVGPETNFLDIGAGTGVWAILAAKLGAKRVVAVEIEECLIPFIHKHAQENGVANQIEIIHGNSNDVKIRGKFDVIVSELFGGSAFGEEVVKSFVYIRERFLAKDGILIPQKLSLFAVPVHVGYNVSQIPASVPLSCNFLRSVRLNYGQGIGFSEHDIVEFLAEPKQLLDLDFRTALKAHPMSGLSASWKVKNLKKANAILTFQGSTFTDDIVMNGFGSQSWGSNYYEFVPFEHRSGELRFGLNLDADRSNWSLSLPGVEGQKPQNYAPTLAFARVRMAQQMTPHRKFRPKKLAANDTAKKTSTNK
ncbi:MAG: 50S ribosomal protein L11 methyltransferase [Pyrinomonadaceae bacterium]